MGGVHGHTSQGIAIAGTGGGQLLLFPRIRFLDTANMIFRHIDFPFLCLFLLFSF